MTPLLSISYLPPISYVATCVRSGVIQIERHEHFVKQTHRNRALIYGANGILPLIIPVQHKDLFRVPIEEVKISYDTPWQKIHWRSIISAYRNAPFFEYFEEEFAAFYQKEINTLCEFDFGLMTLIFRLLNVKMEISDTSSYEKEVPRESDFRNFFNNGKDNKTFENRYRQAFSAIHGFIPGLSIVDLLFNEGTNSLNYLLGK